MAPYHTRHIIRKPTRNITYMPTLTTIHPKKIDVLNTLATRVVHILDENHFEGEKNHLMNVFIENGYNKYQVIKAFKNVENLKNKQPLDDHLANVHLPYILGTTDKIAHIFKKNKIRTTFRPMNTIKKCLKYVKYLIDPKCHKGVYMVPCSCRKTYIGETGRSIHTRIQEHVVNIKPNRSKTSALAEHSSKSNHRICIENSKVVSKIIITIKN